MDHGGTGLKAMPSSDAAQAKQIFFRLIQVQSADARKKLLEKECAGNFSLKLRVNELLRGHFTPEPKALGHLADQVLSQLKSLSEQTREESFAPLEGVIAGKYQILEKLGEGGMGVVYKALQIAPAGLKRTVALKIIKPGTDSKSVLKRFESERAALALMDHPNIARVLDAGEAEFGYPFFVMEFVNGVSLKKYVKENKISLSDFIDLFVKICQAIHHAHQKGVIHCDVKPSNIIISLADEIPNPKIIDFGISRAVAAASDSGAQFDSDAPMGSLTYMSPEQAKITNFEMDIRSDIYSLGVLLYEVLAGEISELPLATQLAPAVGGPPPLPGLALLPPSEVARRSEPGENFIRDRQTRAAGFLFDLKNDLDYVTLKCLERDPAKRYQTAAALAEDLVRFQMRRPLWARPESLTYTLRKFSYRNSWAALAGCLLFVSMALGVVGTTLGWSEARKQNKIAVAALQAANEFAQREKETNAKVVASLENINKVNQLMASLFTDLNPEEEAAGGRPLQAQVSERLAEFAGQLQKGWVTDEATATNTLKVIGESYLGLGLPFDALPILLQAQAKTHARFGKDSLKSVEVTNRLADAYFGVEQKTTAMGLLKENLELLENQPEPGDRESASELERLTLGTLRSLSRFLSERNYADRAKAILEEFLGTPKGSGLVQRRDRFLIEESLARYYLVKNQFSKSEEMYRALVRKTATTMGEGNAISLACSIGLGKALLKQGNQSEALEIYDKSYDALMSKSGPRDAATLKLMVELGHYLSEAPNRKLKARDILQVAFHDLFNKLGEENPVTVNAMIRLGTAYRNYNQMPKSLNILQQALAISQKKWDLENELTLKAMENMALTLEKLGDSEKAIELFSKTAEIRIRTLGKSEQETILALQNLGNSLVKFNRFEEAEPILKEVLELRKSGQTENWRVHLIQSLLAKCAWARLDWAEAIRLHESAIVGFSGMKTGMSTTCQQRYQESINRQSDFFESVGGSRLPSSVKANPGVPVDMASYP